MSKSEVPPISIKARLPANRDKADLTQHEVTIKSIEEDGTDIKYKIGVYALTDAKDRLVYVTWCEEAHDLMVAKGIVNNYQASKDLLLSMLKGAPKSTFKTAIEKHGCDTADGFDDCMCSLAQSFFNEDSIN